MEYLRHLAGALADNPVLYVPVAVFAFSVIAKLTPTKSDDEVAERLWDIIHAAALNPRADRARPPKRVENGRL